MRKIFSFMMISLVTSLFPLSSSAEPTTMLVEVVCPITMDPSSMLSHYGDYIAGFGKRSTQGNGTEEVYFKSTASIKGIPENLNNYINERATYSSTTGEVTCSYRSHMDNTNFDVAYMLTNSIGGQLLYSDNVRIAVLVPFGLR